MPLNQTYEKLIQLLVSVDIPCDVVISTTSDYRWSKEESKKSKKAVKLEMQTAQTESVLCQFLYTYLLQNVHWHFPQNLDVKKTYQSAVKFIRRFLTSKHPNTLCWLLEIINILTAKFQSQDPLKTDPKLKKEFNEIFMLLMQNIGLIMTESFNITYEQGHYFSFAFPPSVYQELRTYEVYFREKKLSEEGAVPASEDFYVSRHHADRYEESKNLPNMSRLSNRNNVTSINTIQNMSQIEHRSEIDGSMMMTSEMNSYLGSTAIHSGGAHDMSSIDLEAVQDMFGGSYNSYGFQTFSKWVLSK